MMVDSGMVLLSDNAFELSMVVETRICLTCKTTVLFEFQRCLCEVLNLS